MAKKIMKVEVKAAKRSAKSHQKPPKAQDVNSWVKVGVDVALRKRQPCGAKWKDAATSLAI